VSLATFTNTMKDITLEYSDREIYNDVRSQIDITVTTVVMDSPDTYAIKQAVYVGYESSLVNGATIQQTLYSKSGLTQITWQSSTAAAGGQYGVSPNITTPRISCTVVSTTSTSCTVSITNDSGYDLSYVFSWVDYQYLSSGAVYSEKTGMSILTVRATDDTSIAKYGRRVFNMVWPLGQTQAETEALAQAYLQRYAEPIPLMTMNVWGKTDALITQIFTRKISDLITIVNTDLGLSADFYINQIDIYHDPYGLVTATWLLEYQRDVETTILFTLDTSSLDGPDILG
jgi:hypothetical protein